MVKKIRWNLHKKIASVHITRTEYSENIIVAFIFNNVTKSVSKNDNRPNGFSLHLKWRNALRFIYTGFYGLQSRNIDRHNLRYNLSSTGKNIDIYLKTFKKKCNSAIYSKECR